MLLDAQYKHSKTIQCEGVLFRFQISICFDMLTKKNVENVENYYTVIPDQAGGKPIEWPLALLGVQKLGWCQLWG